jgi:nucleoside-diphosphate-sugar epimerase
VTEEPLSHKAGYVNSYEQTKHEAEDLVLDHSRQLPVGIYRLSSVVDESGRGGHFRQVIRYVSWYDRFPFFPADPRAPVDLITAEWAARALCVLIGRHFIAGCIRHICAGQANSLCVGGVAARVFSSYEAASDAAVRRPRMISLPEFERRCRKLPAGSRVARALAALMTFIPHLSIAQPFDSTATTELLAKSGVPEPDMSSLLGRVLADEFRREEVCI